MDWRIGCRYECTILGDFSLVELEICGRPTRKVEGWPGHGALMTLLVLPKSPKYVLYDRETSQVILAFPIPIDMQVLLGVLRLKSVFQMGVECGGNGDPIGDQNPEVRMAAVWLKKCSFSYEKRFPS